MEKFNQWEKLQESLKSARENYLDSGYVTKEEFEKIKEMDPSKTFKYMDAMLDYYTNGYIEDLDTLKTDIKKFHTFAERGLIKNKDINSLEYLDFKAEIMDAQALSKTKKLKKIKESDVIIIRNNEKFLIVVPNSYEASCKYGQGTKWCTSSKKEPWHFSNYRYLNEVTLYYIHNKRLPETDKMYKTSVVVDRWGEIYECYNALDELIPLENILSMGLNRSLFKYIPPIIPKEIIEAREFVGNTISSVVKYVKALKDISLLFEEDIGSIYLVETTDGKLDIVQKSNNSEEYFLIGWFSTMHLIKKMWKIIYKERKDYIIDISKKYKIPEELSVLL